MTALTCHTFRPLHSTLAVLLLAAVMIPASAQMATTSTGKFVGNILKITTTVDPDFDTYWNQATPENSGKWIQVEGTRDVMNWTSLDFIYNYSRARGIPFKLHTLIWSVDYPTWMNTLSANEQRAEVEEWIAALAARYPDTEYIDVVNEALPGHSPTGFRNALGGAGTTGWDWVIWSFEKARQYFPNAKLHLNDYLVIDSDSATTEYLTIINLLKARSLIDGIGEQAHKFESTSLTTLQKNLNRLAATGLPFYISELDINIADDTAQLNRYQQLFPIFWTHPSVRGITLWGYKQGQIWQTNAYLLRTDGSERPALTWMKNYIAANPQSYSGSIITPSSGQVLSNEFPVSATATVIYGTPPYTVTFQIKPDSETEFTTVSSDITSPYTADFGYLPVGNYQTRVVVTDADSATVTSAANTFNVTTAPTLLSLNPLDSATGVAVGANLVATFSENIAIGTGDITVKNLSDGTQTTIAVTDTAQVSVSGAVLTINPTADLVLNKNYAVQIAATAVKDLADNTFAGIANDTTWNFTTTLLTLYSSGTMTWNNTTSNWGIVTGGPYNTATWGSGAAAILEGTAGTVTLGEAIDIKALTLKGLSTDNKYTITGSTLNFSSGGSITLTGVNGTSFVEVNSINSAITGSPTVTSSSFANGNTQHTFAPSSGSQTLGKLGGTVVYKLGGSTTGNSFTGTAADNASTKIDMIGGEWALTGLAAGYEHWIRSGNFIISTGTLNHKNRSINHSGGTVHYNNPAAVKATTGGFVVTGGSMDNTSGAAITTSTHNPAMTLNGNWTFIGSNGAASNLYFGNGAVSLNGGTRQVTVTNAATTLAFGGGLSNGGLTKAGAGTLELRGASSYSGTTTVNAGTLKLGANNVIPNASNVTLGTATLDANTRTDSAGTLDVSGNAVINLSSGAALAFADSKAVDWTGGTLNITGTLGTTSLRFGDSADDLTSGPEGQLAKISVNGSGLGTYVLNANGYLVPGSVGPGPVASFAISPIASPQTVGTPITGITIAAKDASNATATSFTGTVTFGGTGGFTGTSANFVAGELSGVSVTPTVAGSNLTFTVDDGTGHSGSATIATILTPYETWLAANAPGSAADDDSDNDGVPNAIEFVLGGDKDTNDVGKLPAVATPGTDMTFTFVRDRASVDPGVSVEIAVGPDLATWPDVFTVGADTASSTEGITVTDNGDGTDTISLAIPREPGTNRFARLVVDIAP